MDTSDITLPEHEAHSQQRFEELKSKIEDIKGNKMGMDNLNDKVNINVGDGGGGGGMAAIIAALGNRNQGSDTAGLIAALGNRDNDNGMNNIWPIILLALLGRGRGGLGGGDDCGTGFSGLNPAQAAMLQTLLEGQSSLRAEVPTTGLETQNAIQQAIGSLALGGQQGFSNVKDSVQLNSAANLAASSAVKDAVQNAFALLSRDVCDVKSTVQTQGCATREVVQAGTTAILSRIDRSDIDDLRSRADRAERGLEINSLRSQVEVNQTVNTTQAQGQQQGQVQFQLQDVNNRINRMCDKLDVVHQVAAAANANIIAGNLGAVTTGAQSSTPTNINSRGV